MDQTINKTVLGNGIKILSRKMPHVRSVSMGVWVSVGARDEKASEGGLSHFIEHMIFKGTTRRTAYQIAKEFDAIGGQTNAFTSMENTCYHAKVMDTQVETMVDILSDIFLNSVFDGREIEKERPVIFQEIGMMEDNPEDYVHQKLGEAFWGDDPLGRSILGSRDNILGFDAAAVKGYFAKFYQPDRMVVSVAGNLDHSQFVDRIAPVFETIKTSGHMAERQTPSGRSVMEINPKDLEQVHICLGTPGLSITDKRRFAQSLMNTIAGGNMSSRLFQTIREQRALAYSVYSFITSYEDTGMFGVYTAVEAKKVLTCISLILKALKGLQSTRVLDDELDDAKEFTKGNLLLASESPDNQMVRLAQNEFYFGKYIPLGQVIDNIESVTKEDILELAKTLFTPDAMALSILGPFKDRKMVKGLMDDF